MSHWVTLHLALNALPQTRASQSREENTIENAAGAGRSDAQGVGVGKVWLAEVLPHPLCQGASSCLLRSPVAG
jgi:hypothetical protein